MGDLRNMIGELYYKVHNADLCKADNLNDCRAHNEIAHILGYINEADIMKNYKDEDVIKLKPFFGPHFRTLWLAARAKHDQ